MLALAESTCSHGQALGILHALATKSVILALAEPTCSYAQSLGLDLCKHLCILLCCGIALCSTRFQVCPGAFAELADNYQAKTLERIIGVPICMVSKAETRMRNIMSALSSYIRRGNNSDSNVWRFK